MLLFGKYSIKLNSLRYGRVAKMDIGENVQNEDLVNDQVAEAISGDEAPAAVPMTAPADDNTAPAAGAQEPAVEATGDEAPSAVVASPPTEPAEPEPEAADEPEPTAEPEAATPSVIANHHSSPLHGHHGTHDDSASSDEPVASTLPTEPADEGPLADIKQKALEQLSPLVGNLDLPPEEKFDTYMEILRASDNEDLIQPAFDIAQQIENEDKKAQALLDVVNEVNYLTQDEAEE